MQSERENYGDQIFVLASSPPLFVSERDDLKNHSIRIFRKRNAKAEGEGVHSSLPPILAYFRNKTYIRGERKKTDGGKRVSDGKGWEKNVPSRRCDAS